MANETVQKLKASQILIEADSNIQQCYGVYTQGWITYLNYFMEHFKKVHG